MESPPRPSGPGAPTREAAREMIARAEHMWQRQVANERMPAPTGLRAALRWLLLTVALGAIVFLMFQRLAELG